MFADKYAGAGAQPTAGRMDRAVLLLRRDDRDVVNEVEVDDTLGRLFENFANAPTLTLRKLNA